MKNPTSKTGITKKICRSLENLVWSTSNFKLTIYSVTVLTFENCAL